MRLTLRGKLVLLFISIVMISTAIILSVHTGFAVKEDETVNYVFYTVQPDDTLWEIAEKYTADGKDVRKTIYEIKRLNDIGENSIVAGMRLAVLKGE